MPVIGKAIASTDEEKAQLDDLLGVQFGSGPDGLPIVVNAEVHKPSALPVTSATLVCIRGPCRHYGEVEVGLDAVNTDQSFRELRRYCRALSAQGELMELTDGNVYRCSLHDPRGPSRRMRLVTLAVVAAAAGAALGRLALHLFGR